MKIFYLPPLNQADYRELEKLSRTMQNHKIKMRADMVLFSAQEKLLVSQIASIVRQSKPTVLRWLKRYSISGIPGLYDGTRSH